MMPIAVHGAGMMTGVAFRSGCLRRHARYCAFTRPFHK